MKPWTLLCMLLLLSGMTPEAWAGPEEEITALLRQRLQAFLEGNVDAYMMTGWADNAIYTSALVPFRIEGKEAIRAFTAELIQTYPTRQVIVRQPSLRFYNNDTVAIRDYYQHNTFVDRKGEVRTIYLRVSQTFVKLRDQWVTVDIHFSRLPVSP